MALAITVEQEQLVEAVDQFVARHAPIDKTRAAFDSIAIGELPPWWEEFMAQGFHAVHLADNDGGQGGTLTDMACVVEAAAAGLLPGPMLSTATASAVAILADDPARRLSADLAAGATAAVDTARTFRLPCGCATEMVGGSTARPHSMLGICAAQRILLAALAEEGSELWFVLDSGAQRTHGFAIEQQQGTDLCTDVGVLKLIRPHS